MKLKSGCLYHINNEYFILMHDYNVIINHDEKHISRPCLFLYEKDNLLWFVPISTKVNKYKKIINNKIKKYKICSGILIIDIYEREYVLLIQNAFPIIRKYVLKEHKVKNKIVSIDKSHLIKINKNFNRLIKLKEKGLNLFFTDIDSIKDKLLNNK